jgi:SAM-dependent methyltransferase
VRRAAAPAGAFAPDDDAALTLSRQAYGDAARLRARIALHEIGAGDREDFHAWLWRHVEAPPTADVLEVGSGSGRMWQALGAAVPAGWRLTLSDVSPGMLAEARRTLATSGRDARFVLADAANLPFADGRFDLAFANHMLYHVPDLPRTIAELGRVLRPGGRLIAATNGDDHLAEIASLLDELAAAWPGVRVDRPHRLSFTLENGGDALAEAFADVVRHDHVDTLVVDDAGVLTRYLLSMVYAGDAEEAGAVAAWARERIADRLRGGPLAVRRASGAFVARAAVR